MCPADRLILNSPPDPAPWDKPRFDTIPGTEAVGPYDWLHLSDTYAAQMQERIALTSGQYDKVIGQVDGAGPAIEELYGFVLETLRQHPDFTVGSEAVICPDGRSVPLGDPLITMAHLVQEDLCIMERQGDEYVLTAAILCFPAGWTLSEKLGRPMIRIHKPVDSYDDMAAKRVGRLFDGLQVGRPILRWNGNYKTHGRLFGPETESYRHDDPTLQERPFFRSERQCLVRLPQTRAILFSIHTYLWRLTDLPSPPAPQKGMKPQRDLVSWDAIRQTVRIWINADRT